MLIACCSDSDGGVFREIIESIQADDPELILFAGDARAGGFGISNRRARRWLKSWGGLANRVVTVPGNHDYARRGTPPWTWLGHWSAYAGLSRFDDRAFVLRLPDLTVIGLDTGPEGGRVDRAQLEWADQQDLGGVVRIAVFHAPAFPTSLHIGSSLDASPAERDALVEHLRRWKVSLAINGHEHLYARRVIEGTPPITQLIIGGGGAGLYENASPEVLVSRSEYHYLLLDVAENQISATSLTPAGQIVDQFSVFPSAVGRNSD